MSAGNQWLEDALENKFNSWALLKAVLSQVDTYQALGPSGCLYCCICSYRIAQRSSVADISEDASPRAKLHAMVFAAHCDPFLLTDVKER